MCLTPISLKKPYLSEVDTRKKIQGKEKDLGGVAVQVPCGKCVQCLRRRASQWAFRLSAESKISNSAVFLTLTYQDCPLSFNGLPTLDKRDCQLFFKRLRKSLPRGNPSVKYYLCGEYGSKTMRPHYHAIVFNLPLNYIQDVEKISSIWQKGIVSVDPCNVRTINYVTKYIMKGKHEPFDDYDDRLPEFSLMSKKMGMSHLTPQMIKYYKTHLNGYVVQQDGVKRAMPRYFKDKIFTSEERKIINEKILEFRETEFETKFNDSFKDQIIWKENQIRKAEKISSLSRMKL